MSPAAIRVDDDSTAHDSDVVDFMYRRRSLPIAQLGEPGPSDDQLQVILGAACRVPDHGALTPWRVTVVEVDARADFAATLVKAYVDETPEPQPARIAKLEAMGATAPTVLIVSSRLQLEAKVPVVEQLLSCGAFCQNIVIAASRMGFGTNWLTGPGAYSPAFKKHIGVEAHDHILGFLFVGTPLCEPKPRPRPALDVIVQRWGAGDQPVATS